MTVEELKKTFKKHNQNIKKASKQRIKVIEAADEVFDKVVDEMSTFRRKLLEDCKEVAFVMACKNGSVPSGVLPKFFLTDTGIKVRWVVEQEFPFEKLVNGKPRID